MYGDALITSIILYTFYIIVLPFFGEYPTVCGIVDVGAYKLTALSPTNYHNTQQHPLDATKAAFLSLTTM